MKKGLRVILSVILIVSLCIVPVSGVMGGSSGQSQGQAQGQSGSGYAEQNAFGHSFNDMTGFDWAEKSVCTMSRMGIIKGEGNGRYAPSRSAKEIEVIAMTLRFLGYEDELDMEAELPKSYKGEDPDDWMISYMDKALDEGILLEDEMDDFNPNAAASRVKTALYMIRALDMVEEAEDHMDEDLPFKDESSVPEEFIGYVYLVHDLGLMIGYNDTFQPRKSVTRAELAVLFARMVSMNDTDYSYTMTGRIYHLVLEDDEMIAIKSGSTYAQYDLDEDVAAYDIDDDEIDLDDLNINDYVKLYIVNDLVVQIDMIEEGTEVNKILKRRLGQLTDIEWDDDEPVAIEVLEGDSTTPEAFDLDVDVDIDIQGPEDELIDEHIGLNIVFYTSDDEVYRLRVFYDRLEGILNDLVYDSGDLEGVTITPEGEDEDDYFFAEGVRININDEESDLEDLEDLYFEEDIVYEVELLLLGDGEVIAISIEFEEE